MARVDEAGGAPVCSEEDDSEECSGSECTQAEVEGRIADSSDPTVHLVYFQSENGRGLLLSFDGPIPNSWRERINSGTTVTEAGYDALIASARADGFEIASSDDGIVDTALPCAHAGFGGSNPHVREYHVFGGRYLRVGRGETNEQVLARRAGTLPNRWASAWYTNSDADLAIRRTIIAECSNIGAWIRRRPGIDDDAFQHTTRVLGRGCPPNSLYCENQLSTEIILTRYSAGFDGVAMLKTAYPVR